MVAVPLVRIGGGWGELKGKKNIRPRPGLEGGNVSLRGHVLIADVVKYVCRRPLAAWSGPAPSTAAPGIYEEW